MLRFDVSPLLDAEPGESLRWDVDVQDRELGDVEIDFLEGEVQVIRVQKGLLARAELETRVRAECVRCLNPFTLPLSLEIDQIVKIPGTKPDTETLYTVTEDGWLDFVPIAREYIWLDLPMKTLCSADCKGLCPHCGINRNLETCDCEEEDIDPRMSALKELLD